MSHQRQPRPWNWHDQLCCDGDRKTRFRLEQHVSGGGSAGRTVDNAGAVSFDDGTHPTTGDFNIGAGSALATYGVQIFSNNAGVAGSLSSANGFSSILNTGSLSADRTFTFPNETGTLALGTGSTGNCATWSSANTLTDTGSACGGGGGSGTVLSGTTGQLPYYAGAGTTLTATSTVFITPLRLVGIGTSTPKGGLNVSWDGAAATTSSALSYYPALHVGTSELVNPSTSGTYFGIKAMPSFAGDVINVQNSAGSTLLKVGSGGNTDLQSITSFQGISGLLNANGFRFPLQNGIVLLSNTFSASGFAKTKITAGDVTTTDRAGTEVVITAGGNELANFQATGKVGIGTTTPQFFFQLATSTAPQLTLSDATSTGPTATHWSFRNSGGTFYLATSSPLTFATSTTEALKINPNGLPTMNAMKLSATRTMPVAVRPSVNARRTMRSAVVVRASSQVRSMPLHRLPCLTASHLKPDEERQAATTCPLIPSSRT